MGKSLANKAFKLNPVFCSDDTHTPNKTGWSTGLTIHTCMINLLPYLDEEDKPRALFHGLSAVANDSAGAPPLFVVQPLPNSTVDFATLKSWFCQFIEVRDSEAAQRCLVSAIRSGANLEQVADMLFSSATDHRYLDIGHTLDFINKALEALDVVGWQAAESVLPSLISGLVSASRMEESNSWRYPVDLVTILKSAFEQLPTVLNAGKSQRGTWSNSEQLIPILLGEDPQAIACTNLSNRLSLTSRLTPIRGILTSFRFKAPGCGVSGCYQLRLSQFPTTSSPLEVPIDWLFVH